MKVLISIIALLGSCILYGQDSEIIVTVKNIKEIKGYIQFGLYNTETPFPKVGKEYKRIIQDVKDDTLICSIKGLIPGKYAIAIYQDLNGDKICNQNFIGIPTEPYGFSNNVVPFLSAPSFKSASFVLEKKKELSISLR